jgi:hypothetical protein
MLHEIQHQEIPWKMQLRASECVCVCVCVSCPRGAVLEACYPARKREIPVIPAHELNPWCPSPSLETGPPLSARSLRALQQCRRMGQVLKTRKRRRRKLLVILLVVLFQLWVREGSAFRHAHTHTQNLFTRTRAHRERGAGRGWRGGRGVRLSLLSLTFAGASMAVTLEMSTPVREITRVQAIRMGMST